MGKDSAIEWTDHTFNPWIGCTKVSAGCKHCYAETLMTRKPRWAETWGPQGMRLRTSEANWRKPLVWNRKAENEGRRYKVFCGSLCDVFERKDDQPELDRWRTDLSELFYMTPNLDWLLLTKRPKWAYWWAGLDNIWLGTSIENQEQADRRIPELMKKTARVRFLSCEPLLEPIDFRLDEYLEGRLTWVIAGGESGPDARPMEPQWAIDIKDQCGEYDVPFFMKQMGGYPNKRAKLEDMPIDLQLREFPRVYEDRSD